MALTAERKNGLAGAEMSAFASQTAQVKAFVKEDGVFGGRSYTI